MRAAFTLLMLANLFAQLFVCCAESCNTCVDPAESEDVPCCRHEGHEHGHPTQAPPDQDSSHHLCVATHLLYVRASVVGFSLDVSHAIVSNFDVACPEISDSLNTIDVVSCCVSPPSSLRVRAALGVWTI